jgi:hypothetical protein
MDIVIINLSKLRVALTSTAKDSKLTSLTALLSQIGLAKGTIYDSKRRFEVNYKDKVNFVPEKCTDYGAIYEDTWKTLLDRVPSLKTSDFEIERIEKMVSKSSGYADLGLRVSNLENTVLNLMNVIEEMRRNNERKRI